MTKDPQIAARPTASSSSSNAASVVAQCAVPSAKGLYVLGCLEERVTLYAQQVRALNLVSALLDESGIDATSKVAVVGAGAAGLTATAAIATALPNIDALHLYERRPDLLHLQLRSRDRYLHPHLYDWPNDGSTTVDAGLPIMNWGAGPAGDVASVLTQEFDSLVLGCEKLAISRQAEVTKVQSVSWGGCRVIVRDDAASSEIYDVVLLSIGFGNERLTDRQIGRSYWDVVPTTAPLRGAAGEFDLFVSGNGDGGLVDFVIAAFNGRTHREICEWLVGLAALDDVKRELLRIEEEAWAPGSTLDIYEAYRSRIAPLVPSAVYKELLGMLRRDATVKLHTRHRELFRRETAILNRFLTFLVIATDHGAGQPKLKVMTGVEIATDPYDARLRFSDGTVLTPLGRFIRFGVDSDANQAPFKQFFDDFRRARDPEPERYRPATPPLSDAARRRFAAQAALRTTRARAAEGAVAPSAAASSTGASVAVVTIHAAGVEQMVWAAPVSADAAGQLWGDSFSDVILACHLSPEEAGPLRFAVARLVSHAPAYQLFCRDSLEWGPFLAPFQSSDLPGPSCRPLLKVRSVIDGGANAYPEERGSLLDMASRIHRSLDLEVLRRLDAHLARCLRPNSPISVGWSIDPSLRVAMLARWRTWHAKLQTSDDQRRRFLILLASEKDHVALGETNSPELVRVGPRAMEAHLVRATVFALAFAVCVDVDLAPSGEYPGNLAGTQLSAHSLGVSWLDGVDVGPDVSLRQWTANVILMSELREAPLTDFLAPRIDSPTDGTPSMAGVPPHEQPLIIGSNHSIRTAMQSGEASLRQQLALVLRSKALTAKAILES